MSARSACPKACLQKTGRLTPRRIRADEKASAIGARFCQDVKQIQRHDPRRAAPSRTLRRPGLSRMAWPGEAFPLMGRIICLADCFDAMTSNRTYRKALPLEVALTEIRRCSGTQFDPVLAEAFLSIWPDLFRDILAPGIIPPAKELADLATADRRWQMLCRQMRRIRPVLRDRCRGRFHGRQPAAKDCSKTNRQKQLRRLCAWIFQSARLSTAKDWRPCCG